MRQAYRMIECTKSNIHRILLGVTRKASWLKKLFPLVKRKWTEEWSFAVATWRDM